MKMAVEDASNVDWHLTHKGWFRGLLNRSHCSAHYKRRPKDERFSGQRAGRIRPVAYTDGDIVGDGAPEVGGESRGMAMMMKMGWTKGMALGIAGNPGILQPLKHVVKTSKMGLGTKI